MQYFTKEWCLGRLDDNVTNEILNNYKNYIKNIFDTLPFTLKLLTKNLNLHDGLIKKVIILKNSKSLELQILCGDLQLGYFFLAIEYLEVLNVSDIILTNFFKAKKLEVLSDEIKMLSKTSFSHKILFSNEQYIDIHFKDIRFFIKNANTKDYKKDYCILEIV